MFPPASVYPPLFIFIVYGDTPDVIKSTVYIDPLPSKLFNVPPTTVKSSVVKFITSSLNDISIFLVDGCDVIYPPDNILKLLINGDGSPPKYTSNPLLPGFPTKSVYPVLII